MTPTPTRPPRSALPQTPDAPDAPEVSVNGKSGAELIAAALPHRHPFVFVDRVLSFKKNESVVALKQVAISEPHFQGHFPGRPLMPGVLMIEALAQACGALMWLSASEEERQSDGGVWMLAGIDECRFRRGVVPGDSLILRAELLRASMGVARFAARAEVDGQVACEARLVAARPRKQ